MWTLGHEQQMSKLALIRETNRIIIETETKLTFLHTLSKCIACTLFEKAENEHLVYF